MELAEGDALPSGTVTFLLTDIENSSGHWELAPSEMLASLKAHDALVGRTVRAHDGAVVKHMGDGCWAAFSSASKAVAAAIDFQRCHQRESADLALSLRVRIGLHTGEINPTEGDYFGPVVNRAARVVDLANGNQIVCSASTAGLLSGVELRSEGRHELRGLGDEDIFMVLAQGIETDNQSLRRSVKPSNLPRSHTSFLGRADDLHLATSLIDDRQPLVTLVGPGGVGKTRLAVEIAAGVSASFQERVYFCDLVPIRDGDADALSEAVAEVVGARRQPGMDLRESIADHLAGRPALVLLDNCEHVIDAVRGLVEVLVGADGLQVLATSREALGHPAERQLLVSPLSPTDAGVQLFVDRARQRDAAFALDDDNADAVRAVVKRLDGIPLAIELAASRIRLMTPVELAVRLQDGFRVLGGDRGPDDRHGALRDTVRWSYDLLSPAEAALFTRLSVFAGGFTLETAEAVCTDDTLVIADSIPDMVMALVDKSMVVSTPIQGRQRFTMLETLRSFAADQLANRGEGEEPTGRAWQRRHAEHFGMLAQRQNDRFYSAAEPDAWRIFDTEWTNLRAALDHHVSAGDVDRGAELVVATSWYANISMRFEAFTWADELLETPGIESHRRYTDLCGAAALGAYFTVNGSATELAETGLAADPSDREGFCRAALAAVAMNNEQNAEKADAVTTAWLESEPATVGGRLWAECFRAFYLCAYAPGPEAAVRVEAATKLTEETGSTTAKALTAWARGQVVSYQDMGEAMGILTEGLEWARSLPGDSVVAHVLDGMILFLTVARNDLASSLRGCRDAVRGGLERHYYAGTSHLFGVTAVALSRAGDATTGARLVGAMNANGHHLRGNARRALEHALGADLDARIALGQNLSITEAAHLAIDALESAMAAVEEEPS